MNTQVRVYVGTYAKYNGGSIGGAWLDLYDYDDVYDFITACHNLHSDESDPEFMIQDREGFPDRLSSCEYVTQQMIDYAKLDDDDREILAAYVDYSGNDAATIDDALDHLCGDYDSFSQIVDDRIDLLLGEYKGFPESWIDRDQIEFDLRCEGGFHKYNERIYFFR